MRVLQDNDLRWVAGGADDSPGPFELPVGNPIRDAADAVDNLYDRPNLQDTDGDGDKDLTDFYNTLWDEISDHDTKSQAEIEEDPRYEIVAQWGAISGIIDAIQGDDNRG